MSVIAFLSDFAAVRARVPAADKRIWRLDRAWNLLLGLAALIAAAPLMAIIAVAIWRMDGGPVVFAHYRVGRDGKLFRCLKFRSMYVNAEQMLRDLLRADPAAQAEWARDQKLRNDPRITPIGNFLRQTSLDELPQFINVLRGEMNLVGPRPITVDELDRYGRQRWHYLAVPPGITGLWQVSGRNDLSYSERVALDRQYVERRSMRLDVGILLRTAAVLAARKGAR